MMADKDMMERVDMKAELRKMSTAEQYFVRKAEEYTVARGTKQKILRKKNAVVGVLGVLAVVGIYSYTMMAVKQEKFLDKFDDMHK